MYEIAHRGYSGLFKDNTLKSFKSAFEQDFSMIELDIQQTKDNIIIIYHDTYLCNNLINTLTYNEVIHLDDTIITLNRFFYEIDYTKIKVYLDLKGDINIAYLLHDFLHFLPKTKLSQIYIGSFNVETIKIMHTLNPLYKLGIITNNNFDPIVWRHFIESYDLSFVTLHWTILDKKNIEFIHNYETLVFAYTCKNYILKQIMESYNVDGIVTNYKLYTLSADEKV